MIFARHWKINVFSGVVNAPASEKGSMDNAPALGCTIDRTADSGHRGHPPSTVPADMVVVVPGWENQSGWNELGLPVRVGRS